MLEKTNVDKSKERGTKPTRIEKKGGYEPGPKTVSQLAPPPKNPGAGSKPSSGTPGSGSSSRQ